MRFESNKNNDKLAYTQAVASDLLCSFGFQLECRSSFEAPLPAALCCCSINSSAANHGTRANTKEAGVLERKKLAIKVHYTATCIMTFLLEEQKHAWNRTIKPSHQDTKTNAATVRPISPQN